jgi:uncharacterized protein
MLEIIQQNLDQIAAICRKHGVKRLDLFGSAARGDFDPAKSDVDFFYEFDPSNLTSVADRYFGLWEELEKLFGRKVDLVSLKDAWNPYFLKSANENRVSLYAA